MNHNRATCIVRCTIKNPRTDAVVIERISIERIGFFQLDNVDFPVGTLCDD